MYNHRFLALVALPLFACSCSSSSASNNNTDAGGDSGGPGGDSGSGMVTQKGRIIDHVSKAPAPSITIGLSTGGTTTTDANGVYSFQVPKGQPFSFYEAGDQKVKLWEQEESLSGDTDRGDTEIVNLSTEHLLKAFLTGYDATLGTFTVGIDKTGNCATTEGAMIDLDPPQAAAKHVYFASGIPDGSATYAHDGELPAAVFYNVPLTTQVKLKLTWAPQGDAGAVDGGVAAPCQAVAYPMQDPARSTLTFTGNLKLEAGDVTSFYRVFVQ
jgi:hypothetical protein